ncbi:hypothetical protein PL321_10245 [Caloramator sp. mosi_1]|uniref:hypothetical protein n=1 Tax=Caloramator sp. mosi_1 TaxID=3023090 RepID=UPI00235FD38B|nr:hypothetical protein [Caloramator sp. mosi_1]WDC83195.1 hypothetical protein PL321_10245 [Caloramator sp. mosi_1]
MMVLVSPYLIAWTNLMIKDRVLKNKVDFRESFKSSSNYYLRILVVVLSLMGALIVYLFMSVFIIGILYVTTKGSLGVFIIGNLFLY